MKGIVGSTSSLDFTVLGVESHKGFRGSTGSVRFRREEDSAFRMLKKGPE